MRGLTRASIHLRNDDGLPGGKTRFALLPGNDEMNRKGRTNG
jgi:hypothetical protein